MVGLGSGGSHSFRRQLRSGMFKLPAMPGVERHGSAPKESLWKYRHLILGAAAIFVYVGAEVSIGSFLVNYFSQPEIGNVSENVAARYVSFYWGSAMIGRFIGSAVLQKLRTGTVLGFAAAMASLLVCISMLTGGHVAMPRIDGEFLLKFADRLWDAGLIKIEFS